MSEPILSYPLDVDEKDGHYILLTIFESAGVDYPSPFTDINLPQNRYNLSQIRQLGESNTKALRLRNAVTSPKGTTEAGLKVLMKDNNFFNLVKNAINEAKNRGKDLGKL